MHWLRSSNFGLSIAVVLLAWFLVLVGVSVSQTWTRNETEACMEKALAMTGKSGIWIDNTCLGIDMLGQLADLTEFLE